METKRSEITAKNEMKNIAIIAYITIIGLLIAFIMNNNKKDSYAKYHIGQSLGLVLTGLILGVIGLIPILGWLVNLVGIFVLFFMWIMGLLNAINNKKKPVPLLGDKYEEWFANL